MKLTSAPRTCLLASAAYLLLASSLASASQLKGSVLDTRPTALTCEALLQPMGVDAERPMLAWKLQDSRTGAKQTAYRVEVASRLQLLEAGKPDVWDSGRITSAQSAGIAYGGPALAPETRYFWRVQAWDQSNKPYPQSAATWWETGLHADWKSQWIGYEDLEHRSIRAAKPRWITNPSVPAYKVSGPAHHDFRLTFDLSANVKHAILYATGEDTTAAWINGESVLSAKPQPKWGRRPWRTYERVDVTPSIHTGSNTLAVDVLLYAAGDQSQAAMSAELYLEMKDGTTQVVTTDKPEWKTSLNAAGTWYQAKYDDATWASAVVFPEQADAFGALEPLGNPLQTGPVVALRHGFSIAKPIRSARLYATALGAYTFNINGQTVGDQVLAPGWTDFRQHVTYQTYDVTSLLTSGPNAVAAYLAPGWYATPLEWLGQGNNYGDTQRALKAQLRIEHTDGSIEWVATDGTWKADDSPITTAEIYDGETLDARLNQPGWDKRGFSDTGWSPVAIVEPKKTNIEWQSFQPIRAIKTVAPVTVKRTADGRSIYDFGQELSGVARISLHGKAGTDVRLRFAEVLNDDGTIYIENLRNAKATDHFILSGHGTEEYQPTFTFHGFRYVEVSGVQEALSLAAVKAIVLHTDAPDTVELSTGSPMVNKLWSNIRWGQWSNFVGVPTDCPQRDERLGWTADAQVFWRAASYNMNLAAFSRKYAADLRGTQATTPMYGIYAPGTTKPNNGFGSGWSDAGVVVPWTSWLQTGDTTIAAQNWDGMSRYLAEIERINPDHLWKEKSGTAFGDWLSPEGTTSQVLISTAYWAYDVTLMLQMAHALGKTADEQKYATLFASISQAFDKEFVRPDGYVGILNPDTTKPAHDRPLTESQTGYVLALHMKLLPADLREKATKRLVDRIEKNGWKLATGFLGTPYLLEVLTQSGYSEVSYRLLLNEQYPSWGYMVDHGATTMWERWNGDAMRSDPGMNSYNHYAYGAVAEWIYRFAAGVDTTPMDPGFHTVVLHPSFNTRLGSLQLTYQSPYGAINSNWKLAGTSALWTVTIPPNSSAQLSLSIEEQGHYKMDGQPLNASSVVTHAPGESGQIVYTLPAGSFTFTVDLPQEH